MAGVSSYALPAGLVTNVYNTGTNQEFQYINASPELQARLKELVKAYGAVSIGYYVDTLDMNTNNPAGVELYNNQTFESNHAVTIVGWDDTYEFVSDDLKTKPQGKGAWILRNSWGTWVGNQGYQYLSYEDMSLQSGAAFSIETDAKRYTTFGQHAPLGITDYFLDSDTTSKGFASTYTAEASQFLKAVGFYVVEDSSSYEIEVRAGTNTADGGTVVYTQKGTFGEDGSDKWLGYRTVNFDSFVLVPEAGDYTVVVKLISPNGTVQIPISSYGYERAGESFVYDQGRWMDLTNYGSVAAAMQTLGKETAAPNGGDFTTVWLHDSGAGGSTIDLGSATQYYQSDVFHPERKTLSNMTVDLTAGRTDSVYGGTIIGEGNVLKIGTGQLTLTGTNTYTGLSTVVDGIFQVDGSIAGDAISTAYGTLAGSGRIGGNVINGGILQAGSDGNVGTLTINGNLYSHGAISVALQNGQAGLLAVQGIADIDQTKLLLGQGSTYQVEKSYPFLTSAGDMTGVFAETPISGMLTSKGTHDGHMAQMYTVRENHMTGLSPQQLQSYDAMNTLYDALANDARQREMDGLYNLAAAQASQAMSQVYGGTQVNLAMQTQQNTLASGAVLARLGQAKQTVNSSVKLKSLGFAEGNGVETNVVIPLELDAQNRWWMKLSKGWNTTDAMQNMPELKSHGFNWTIGRDKMVEGDWRVGSFVSYGTMSLGSASSSGENHDVRVGVYGGYEKNRVSVDTYLDYGQQNNRVKRSIATLGLTADSNYDSDVIEAGVKAQYNLHEKDEKTWQVSPYAGLAMAHYHQDGYTESGAGVYSQRAESLRNTYSTGEVGIALERQTANGSYGLNFGYKRVLSGSNPEMTIAYTGNQNQQLKISGSAQDKDYVVAGFHAAGEIAPDWTVNGQVNQELGSHSKNLSAEVTVRFCW